MNIPAKLLLIPSCMLEKINKEGANVEILSDAAKLSNIFTVEDVAFYISINNLFNTYGSQWDKLFKDLLDTFVTTDIYNMSEDNLGRESLSNSLKGGLTPPEYLERVKRRSDSQLVMNELVGASDLATQHKFLSVVTRSNNNANIYVFTLAELTENVFGLIVKSLSAESLKDVDSVVGEHLNTKAQYNSILETLSKFYQISDLSQTPLFKGYVMLESE